MPEAFAGYGTLINLAFLLAFFAVITVGGTLGLAVVLLNQIRVDMGKFQEAITKTNEIISNMTKLYTDVAKAVDDNLKVLDTLRSELYVSVQRSVEWKRRREEANQLKQDAMSSGEIPKEWKDDWNQ